jgi:hypothetical protein
MKKPLFSLILCLFSICAFSQAFEWATKIGDQLDQGGWVTAVDRSGNIFTAGYFDDTLDFDPGAGVYKMVPKGFTDACITKLDAQGNFLWAKSFGGSYVAAAVAVATDSSGNVYVSGWFGSTVDFDPGSGTFNMVATIIGHMDLYIVKLSPAGNFVWAKQIMGKCEEYPKAITIDKAQNVILSFESCDTIDADPGSGVYKLIPHTPGHRDVFIVKLNSSGNFMWGSSAGSRYLNHVISTSTDDSGNVYSAGTFEDTVVFTQGSGKFSLISAGDQDVFLLKLNAAGDFQWAKRIGNRLYNNAGYMNTDASGNIYMAGIFRDTLDFDPGSGVYNKFSQYGAYYILKLTANGDFVKVTSTNLLYSINLNYIAIDDSARLYITGMFRNTADFDPGSGNYSLTSGGDEDVFILNLDSSLSFIWALKIGGTSNIHAGEGNFLGILDSGYLYVAGDFYGTLDFNPGPASYNMTCAGTTGLADYFVAKLGPCKVPGSLTVTGSSLACAGDVKTYTVNAGNSAIGYNWSVPPGATINSGQNTDSVSVRFGTSGGVIKVTAINSCGNGYPDSINVKVNPLPAVSFIVNPSASVCAGSPVTLSGSGATTYTWSGSVSDGVSFVPDSTALFIVTGTDSLGCKYTDSATITVHALPTVTAAAKPSAKICTGDYISLHGAGASTYSWSNAVSDGSPFVPTTGGMYSVTGTDTNGCVNTDSISITVNSLPVVSASVSPSAVICSGTPVTLTGSGAASYSWSGSVTDGVNFIPSSGNTYIVTGTDSNGCSSTDSIQITVNPLPAISINASPTSAVCKGDTVVLTGKGGLTYAWSGGISNAVPFIPAASGIYLVEGTDSNGCVNRDSIIITLNVTSVGISVVPSAAVCTGTPVTLIATGATSYSWKSGILNGIPFTPLQTAEYIVTGTDTNGCSDTAFIKLIVHPLPGVSVTVDPAATICRGTEVTLSATGAVTYSWTGNVTNSVPFAPSATNTYFVTGTDSNGCTDTSSVMVTVNLQPQFILHPANQTLNYGSDAIFFITLWDTAVQLKWQEDQGNGFIDLSNSGQFSGVDNDSLRISNVIIAQHNFRYRCIAMAGSCADTSVEATLIIGNVGTGKVKDENSFAVYPNPSSGGIFIEALKWNSAGYFITDLTGRIILSGNLTAAATWVDLELLSTGLYFVQFGQAKPLKLFRQ